ncbi:hypothetical protein ACFRH6_23060 [Streptomyces sp. NPDC056749]|uniref:hypothetical protein n=1 Tax=Streptomyces sp. NPDC056749 TaxID=3345936 RepID=UPI0036C3532D
MTAFRGLRRAEGVGQNWTDANLDASMLTVASEIVQDGWRPDESEPKSDSSANPIGLDMVAVLRAHPARQSAERLKWGAGRKRMRKAFTKEIGLPPINLRDLRYRTATLTKRAAANLHTVEETLRRPKSQCS